MGVTSAATSMSYNPCLFLKAPLPFQFPASPPPLSLPWSLHFACLAPRNAQCLLLEAKFLHASADCNSCDASGALRCGQ